MQNYTIPDTDYPYLGRLPDAKKMLSGKLCPLTGKKLIVPPKNHPKPSCNAESKQNRGAVIYNIHSGRDYKGYRTPQVENEVNGIAHGDHFTHNGKVFQVNDRDGLLADYLTRSLMELDAALVKWKRVLTIRFDLRHSGVTYPNNTPMTKFLRKLRKNLIAQYGMSQFGYTWVREHEPDKSQHYHVVLYLDGDKVRTSHKVAKMVKTIWGRINPAHDVSIPPKPYTMIKQGQRDHNPTTYGKVKFETNMDSFVYRLSYLAKTRGKGEGTENHRVKSWSTSRLAKAA